MTTTKYLLPLRIHYGANQQPEHMWLCSTAGHWTRDRHDAGQYAADERDIVTIGGVVYLQDHGGTTHEDDEFWIQPYVFERSFEDRFYTIGWKVTLHDLRDGTTVTTDRQAGTAVLLNDDRFFIKFRRGDFENGPPVPFRIEVSEANGGYLKQDPKFKIPTISKPPKASYAKPPQAPVWNTDGRGMTAGDIGNGSPFVAPALPAGFPLETVRKSLTVHTGDNIGTAHFHALNDLIANDLLAALDSATPPSFTDTGNGTYELKYTRMAPTYELATQDKYLTLPSQLGANVSLGAATNNSKLNIEVVDPREPNSWLLRFTGSEQTTPCYVDGGGVNQTATSQTLATSGAAEFGGKRSQQYKLVAGAGSQIRLEWSDGSQSLYLGPSSDATSVQSSTSPSDWTIKTATD